MSSNLAALAALEINVEKPFRLFLVHAKTKVPLLDAEKKQAFIDVFSSDSEIARKARHNADLGRVNASSRGSLTPEENDRIGAEYLASISAGWYLVGFDGKPIDLPFSVATAADAYSRRGFQYIARGVSEFSLEPGNFVAASSSK